MACGSFVLSWMKSDLKVTTNIQTNGFYYPICHLWIGRLMIALNLCVAMPIMGRISWVADGQYARDWKKW